MKKECWVDISIETQSQPDYLISSPKFKELVRVWFPEERDELEDKSE